MSSRRDDRRKKKTKAGVKSGGSTEKQLAAKVERRRGLYAGPFDDSNWLILRKLAIGKYPGHLSRAHNGTMQKLYSAGFNVFVNLQTNAERQASTPYTPLLQQLADEEEREGRRPPGATLHSPGTYGPDVEVFGRFRVFNCPIELDARGTTTKEVTAHVLRVLKLLVDEPGAVVYMHCWDGGRRCKFVGAMIIGCLCSMDADEAIEEVSVSMQCRRNLSAVDSSFSVDHTDVVEEVLASRNDWWWESADSQGEEEDDVDD